jgi:hypothetical protein
MHNCMETRASKPSPVLDLPPRVEESFQLGSRYCNDDRLTVLSNDCKNRHGTVMNGYS